MTLKNSPYVDGLACDHPSGRSTSVRHHTSGGYLVETRRPVTQRDMDTLSKIEELNHGTHLDTETGQIVVQSVYPTHVLAVIVDQFLRLEYSRDTGVDLRDIAKVEHNMILN